MAKLAVTWSAEIMQAETSTYARETGSLRVRFTAGGDDAYKVPHTLTLRAQFSAIESGEYSPDHSCYGWNGGPRADVGVEMFGGADLDDCEKAIKVLGAIRRKLDTIEAESGYPESFGEMAQRVMRALGIKAARRYPDGQYGPSWIALSDVRNEVNRRVADKRREMAGIAV